MRAVLAEIFGSGSFGIGFGRALRLTLLVDDLGVLREEGEDVALSCWLPWLWLTRLDRAAVADLLF